MNLCGVLIARIKAAGPISVAEYMAECLLHPEMGYYTTRDPLGKAGDFITSPEISQMFGELLGLCLAQAWRDQGAPEPFCLAELGPGRGTLMVDALRATRTVPGFHGAMQLVLIEASPALRATQSERLAAYAPKWCASVDDLPAMPLFFAANEFFDALPIRQFIRDGAGWRERRIGHDGARLAFGLGPALAQPALSARFLDAQDGDMVEDCPMAAPIMAALGDRIATHGGAGVIVDYGAWGSRGDTLQAVARHGRTDPLADPGGTDLTAHVDFSALAGAAPCATTALTGQGVFLERLGIVQRSQDLAQGLRGTALEAHIAAHRRLTHPDEMGDLFKVVGLHPPQAPPPPGLEA